MVDKYCFWYIMPSIKNVNPKHLNRLKIHIIGGYGLALVMLALAYNAAEEKKIELLLLYAVLGFMDCTIGDIGRKDYMRIKQALKDYKKNQNDKSR